MHINYYDTTERFVEGVKEIPLEEFFPVFIPEIRKMIDKEFKSSNGSLISSSEDDNDIFHDAIEALLLKIKGGIWKQFNYVEEPKYLDENNEWDDFYWSGWWEEGKSEHDEGRIYAKREKTTLAYLATIETVMQEIINRDDKGNRSYLTKDGEPLPDLKRWFWCVGRNAVIDKLRKNYKKADASFYRTSLSEMKETSSTKSISGAVENSGEDIFLAEELKKDIFQFASTLDEISYRIVKESFDPSPKIWEDYVALTQTKKRKNLKKQIPFTTLCMLLGVPSGSWYKPVIGIKRYIHVNHGYEFTWKEMGISNESSYDKMVENYTKIRNT